MIDSAPKPKEDANKELADKIATAIKRSGHSAKWVANECGVTPQAVNGWLNTGRIAKKMLAKLAEVLEIPLGYFLSDIAPSEQAGSLPVIGPINGDKMLKLMVLFSQSTEAGQDLILSTAEFVAKKPR